MDSFSNSIHGVRGNTVPGTVGSERQRTFHTPCVPDLHSLGKKFSFFLLIQKNSLTFAI